MTRIITLVLTGVFLAGTASAEGLPEFDYEAHCADVAEFGGGSYSIERSCLDMEVRARDALMGREIEPRIMRHCADVAEFGGGSMRQ